MNQEKKRLAMAGCGKLAGIVAQAMERGLLNACLLYTSRCV